MIRATSLKSSACSPRVASAGVPIRSPLVTITNKLMAKHTGQSLERIERDVERDFIMNAPQAKEYGIIDEIIDRPPTTTNQQSGR